MRSASSGGVRRLRRLVDRHAQPAGGARGEGEGEGSVVSPGDAVHDGQSEAHASMAGSYAFGAALEGLGERGDELWAEVP